MGSENAISANTHEQYHFGQRNQLQCINLWNRIKTDNKHVLADLIPLARTETDTERKMYYRYILIEFITKYVVTHISDMKSIYEEHSHEPLNTNKGKVRLFLTGNWSLYQPYNLSQIKNYKYPV